MAWEYEDELTTACEEGNEEGKRKAAAAYQKYWKRLNILGQEPVCFMLLTKGTARHEFLEKVQKQTGLAFHVGF